MRPHHILVVWSHYTPLYIMKKRDIHACMLLINDIHLSKDNIPEFHKNWNEALCICKERGIETLVVGGDLWQSRAGQTLNVLMAAREAILKATAQGIYVIIENGNHDKVDQESILSYNHIFSAYPDVEVVDDYAGYDVSDNVTLWLISYFPENGSFNDKLNEVASQIPSDKMNILYCHEGINGALSTSSDKELSPKVFKAFDKVLVGHYHDQATLSGGKIQYIGSSRQHNFGENPEKGYTILFSDGSTEFIKNHVNIQYLTIKTDADNLDDVKQQLQTINDGQTKVRLKIACTAEQASTLDKQTLIELGVSKIEVATEDSMSCAKVHDFDTKYDKDGLKQEYTRYCIQKEIENVEMGLQYLDKINTVCGN